VSTTDDECPGKGLCHGCLKWCDFCDDVTHVCDMRLDGKRCDCHPTPPQMGELRDRRADTERRLRIAEANVRAARRDLEELAEQEHARRVYLKQVSEQEARIFGGSL
jgi:hypothetical protein